MASARTPRVSVLVPLYNGGRYIADTVRSVLGQTFADFELIVLDDLSTDDGPEIVRSFDDPRIRLETNPRNLGNGESRNRLISLARGEYCAMLDHDDIACPDRLQKQVDFLDSHPDTDVCSGGIKFIDGNGEPKGFNYYNSWMTHEQIKVRTLFCCAVANVTLMFRREKVVESGLRYENGGADDMSFYRGAVRVLRFANIPDLLVEYRAWDGQFSVLSNEKQQNHAVESILFALNAAGYTPTEEEKAVIGNVLHRKVLPSQLKTFRRYGLNVLDACVRSGGYDAATVAGELKKIYRKSCYHYTGTRKWFLNPALSLPYLAWSKKLARALKAKTD